MERSVMKEHLHDRRHTFIVQYLASLTLPGDHWHSRQVTGMNMHLRPYIMPHTFSDNCPRFRYAMSPFGVEKHHPDRSCTYAELQCLRDTTEMFSTASLFTAIFLLLIDLHSCFSLRPLPTFHEPAPARTDQVSSHVIATATSPFYLHHSIAPYTTNRAYHT